MGRHRKGKPIHGWLAIHKAVGYTSTRVVAAVRRITGAAKAGHGGTLDPFSEGILPIALGEATKALSMVLEGDKAYRCWVRFGSETDTGDPTGQVTDSTGQVPDPESLLPALARFTGELQQKPPAYSAVRIQGERAYNLARRGEAVVLASRAVFIRALHLESYADGLAQIFVRCSKGTYMRSLAQDLGRELGCLAFLERLLRVETLGFSLQDGITLEHLSEAVDGDRLGEVLMPVDRVLDDIPALRLRVEAWHKVESGQPVWIKAQGDSPSDLVRLMTPEGRFAAIGELAAGPGRDGLRLCRPKRLFHTP